MEEGFPLAWDDATSVVQTEEVICGMENEILPEESAEFTGVCEEVVVPESVVPENVQEVQEGEIMYITDDNVIVMQQDGEQVFQEQFIEQTTEEIVTEQWAEECPEEIIIGSEEAIDASGDQANEDIDIPLPTQDEYTAARPYPCDFCSRRFRKKANLMNHMVAHQTDRPHGCNLCGVRYMRKCDLMNHLKIHACIPETDGLDEEDGQPLDEMDPDKARRRSKPFMKKRKKPKIKEEYVMYDSVDRGASCSRTYDYVNEDMRLLDTVDNKSELAEYMLETSQPSAIETRYPITDPRKPFVCQHCGVGFAREKALASHARVHGGDSPFECQKCGEMFWDVALMREHLRNKHGDLDDFDDDEDEDYSEEDTKYGTFYCPSCGLSFHRQDNLKRHQRIHVKEEFVNDYEFGHVCNVCGESFPKALELLAHAECHARGSEHRCMICGEVCPDEQSIANHVQNKHGKSLPPNTCMLCGRTCKDRKTLLKHSWEHSKAKSFACSQCAKTFYNKARLKRHMLSHRSKAVTCDTCGEEFPDGRSLMNHRHSHSSVSGRQFPCRECGKTFGSRSSQQIHIRIHTGERPYGCRFCWKAFADGGTLRKHERIHTGEKPYACAVCPRAFNQRVVLREHIRSHHSAPDPKFTHTMTPYCCAVCSDLFATSQDLIVHLIHHCDLNTAMKRQPHIGPRKYKRRRKLKPHELEMISNRVEEPAEEQENNVTDTDEEREQRKKAMKKPKKSPPKPSLSETYTDLYNSCSTAIENINSIVNSKPVTKSSKKKQKSETMVPSRPKMIHTQKTRVPVETGEDGKVRHKTKTLVTRTQPTELRSATGERIRPRTKNVSYHVFNSEKFPLATFPDDDTSQAVNNLLKMENVESSEHFEDLNHENGIGLMEHTDNPPEIASEQTVETDSPVPTNIIHVTKSTRKTSNSLKPGRHIIGPGSKVVRLVKGGMIVTKKKKSSEVELEPENILPDLEPPSLPPPVAKEEVVKQVVVKQEMIKQEVIDQSPLHELAEISMQHAQSLFKCEMCSEVFSDRAQLLVHVPIHI